MTAVRIARFLNHLADLFAVSLIVGGMFGVIGAAAILVMRALTGWPA